MEMQALKQVLQENGIVGAGGAGFPTYAKLDQRAEVILMNCAECEPLLKLHRQLMEQQAEAILRTFDGIARTVGAREAVIGIKREYKAAVKAIETYIDAYPDMRIQLLDSAYPMGDEVVLIYEATGRVIRPGGLPIEEGVAVFNVETVYNVYRALERQTPVIDKLVSVVGEVEHPITLRVPIGASIGDVAAYAGGIKVKEPGYLVGGPMMGNLATEHDVVTKTTNAIIVLDKSHALIQRKNRNAAIDLKRAASSCCQCRTCTEMCPRHALGHPIEPHRVMRALANQDTGDLSVYMNTAYCSSCGLCENYACPQGLSPRSVIAEFKNGLRAAGIRSENPKVSEVADDRELKKVPVKRLKAKLGLYSYDVPAPFIDTTPTTKYVRIQMSQHIGAPAKPFVKAGEQVKKGQKIANAAEGLSVAIHCSIDGVVEKADEREVIVREN